MPRSLGHAHCDITGLVERANIVATRRASQAGQIKRVGTRRQQWRTQEFCSGGGGLTNTVEDIGHRERRSGDGSPLVRGSGGSCNLVQVISFHIVKFS